MTFSEPKYIKPNAAIIANLDFWDVVVGEMKIGTMLKQGDTVHLNIFYKEYQFKASERKRIAVTIELQYALFVFHVVSEIEAHTDGWNQFIAERKAKLKDHKEFNITE